MGMKQWTHLCKTSDLVKDSGVCALMENTQIALFYLSRPKPQVYAIDNFDPIGKANVMSRGIVGSLNDEPVVASPLYKQHFSLIDGQCLEDEGRQIAVYPARIQGGDVQLSMAIAE
ncbi:nitrite reductase small subunit NirD [Pseudoteredinibacter isoporae]|uniref:nitrite reductase small subunit NirD n=1 Tax=Pseudoteredinibacter isoporae TaxID=570281 RepID=UPI003101C395